MRELTNFDIDHFFRKNLKYGGCLAKDMLYLEPRKYAGLDIKKFYIINMDDHTGEGTHWVLCSLLNKDIGVYCDSFACPPPKEVLQFMKRYRDTNVMNDNIIQDVNSTNCGYFMCYVADQLSRGRLLIDIMAGFSPKETENEKTIVAWAKSVGLHK